MPSSSSETTKLVLTAVGAAVVGAAAGVFTVRMLERHKLDHDPSEGRPLRSSMIFEDQSERGLAKGGKNDTIIFPHNHEERMRRKIAARASVEEENLVPRQSVTVRVPATSANMGPGCELFKIFMIGCSGWNLWYF